MTDYIKRKEAHDAVMNTEPVYGMCKDGVASVAYQKTVDVIEAIDAIPSADVAPVRHAMWIEYGENKDGAHNMRCSKCGAGLKSKGHANSYYTKHRYRYCQNCGAKMDEGKDNED